MSKLSAALGHISISSMGHYCYYYGFMDKEMEIQKG